MGFEQILNEFIKLRSYERLFGISIGALSIILGYLLFRSGIETPQSAIAKIGKYEFKFLKVAPGFFFSLFGVLLVGYITYEHPTLESVKENLINKSENQSSNADDKAFERHKIYAGFSNNNYNELLKLSKAIHTAQKAIKSLPGEQSKGINFVDKNSSYGDLAKAINSLSSTLADKIFNSFPAEVFAACAGKRELPEGYTTDICEKINDLKKVEMK